MLRLVGHPVAVNPDKELARVARAEGWEIMRLERLGRRLRMAALAALLSGGIGLRKALRHVSLHELTDDQREIRELTQALRGREDRARTRRSGIASTTSRASCSPSSASSG